MSASGMNASGMSLDTGFYVVGGTLQLDAPCYVTRRADKELYESLAQGKFCYVLTPRQMGKSSLMIRAADGLREEGAAVAALDLTAVGQNLDAEQWYGGLLNQIGQQLNLEDELLEFWDRHSKLGPLQRWMLAVREVALPRASSRLVIFVDEIDAVRNLPFSTDEFFAGIREFYNRRADDAELRRLAFCLLGVATPSDLIRETRTTPFNIGQRIELADFTETEAAPLTQGLNCEPKVADSLLRRILYWTGGHPYLTQRLFQAVADGHPQSAFSNPGRNPRVPVRNRRLVDRLCEELFLSSRARELDDNLLFVRERILRSEADLASLLDLYSQARNQKRVHDDETNPLVSVLRLSGITRAVAGDLKVRNRIYDRVFDREWIAANMPDAELRRQRAAYRRGLLRATVAAAVILIVMGVLSVAAVRGRRQAVEQSRIAVLEKAKAEQERSRAEREAEKARRANLTAERLLAETENQREIAEERGAEAERQGLSNRRLLYATQMNLAQKAWETNNTARVLGLLEGQQKELRGFEWHYLWRLCHSDLLTLLLPVGYTSMAVSPSGKMVAAAGTDKTIRIWDVVRRQEQIRFKAQAEGVKAIAFSADDKLLAVGGEDGAVRIWEVVTGKEIISKWYTDLVTVVTFSPDGRQLAIGNQDGAAILLDVATREVSAPFAGHTHSVISLAFSPDGKLLATGSEDRTARVWDVSKKKELYPPREHTDDVTSVAFSRDGARLATGSQDGIARLWEAVRGQELVSLREHTGAITAIAFSRDGKRLATGSSDNTFKLWDGTIGQSLLTGKGHTGAIVSLAFSQDGGQLVTCSSDRSVKLWSLTEEPGTLSGEHTGQITSLAFSPDGKLLATTSSDRTTKLWEASTGKELGPLEGDGHKNGVTSVAFSRDGKWLATGSNDRTVKLWNPVTRRRLDAEKLLSPVNSLAFSPNSRLLAVGMNDGMVKLRDVSGGREFASLIGSETSITCVTFSSDGRLLAIASDDGVARLWDVAMRKEIYALREHKDAVISTVFSPDNKLLVTGSLDGTAKLWDVVTRRRLAIFEESAGLVTAVAFSPDGKRLAIGNNEGAVKLWDVDTRQEVYTFKEHSGRIYAIAFSPDGRSLATGSLDKTWKIFRATTDKEVNAHDLKLANNLRIFR